MTNRANLARQMIAYTLAHPDKSASLLEYLAYQAICGDSPGAIASLIPEPETTMGAALIQSIRTYQHELNTPAPQHAGAKQL